MRNFIERVLSTLIGVVLFFVLFLLVSFLFFKSNRKQPIYKPTKKDILLIRLKGDIKEKPYYHLYLTEDTEMSLLEIKYAIKAAKVDPNILAIRINFSKSFKIGWAQLEEIRKILLDFKESGKTIISDGTYYSNKAYYLGSVADKIFLQPEGMFVFPGMSVTYNFYRQLLEKLKIKPLEFRVGEYKSFIESFTRNSMSHYNRIQTTQLLFHINNTLLQGISTSRDINIDKLKSYASTLAINVPEDALDKKMIDQIGYESDVDDYFKEKFSITEKEKVNYCEGLKYLRYLQKKGKRSKKKANIVILNLEGEIVYGKGQPGESIGSEELTKMIRKIKEEKEIEAVILRINSPGGSALASDIIWHELMELKKEGKLIVTSMSTVAASGGYYISAASDYVFANSMTITGSIGIFTLLFDTKLLFEEKLGIYQSGVQTDPSSDLFQSSYGIRREMTLQEKGYIQNILNSHYRSFIQKVADARKMDVEKVDKIARGRVWNGSIAREIGLVDQIGTLDDAIKYVIKTKNITEPGIIDLPHTKSYLELLIMQNQRMIKSFSSLFKNTILEKYLTPLKSLGDLPQDKFKARMPYDIEIN